MNQKKVRKSIKDLDVYTHSYRLAVEIDQMTKNLPKHEFWEEGQQRKQIGFSYPAQIAEGFGRKRYPAE